MKSRRRVCAVVMVTVALIGVYVLFSQAAVASGCDPNYVSQDGNVFTVSPTGVDDTANIQCAFDEAVPAGPGSTVQLEEGTFYLSRDIVVLNFDGSFKGAGKGVSIVQNLDDVPFPCPRHDCSKVFTSLVRGTARIGPAFLNGTLVNPIEKVTDFPTREFLDWHATTPFCPFSQRRQILLASSDRRIPSTEVTLHGCPEIRRQYRFVQTV